MTSNGKKMKKIGIFLISLIITFCSSSLFAAIKVFSEIPQPPNGQDYVGVILDAQYFNEDGKQIIRILTVNDGKNESNLAGLHLEISGSDIPFGLVLSNSLNKKIAVYGGPQLYTGAEIHDLQMVTDEYWYGSDEKFRNRIKK